MRHSTLPQLKSSKPYLTEAGFETTLLFRHNIDLPHFASFPLLSTPSGRALIESCYEPFFSLASRHKTGLVIEAPTWRASLPWIRKMNMPDEKVGEIAREAIAYFRKMSAQFMARGCYEGLESVVVSGCLGPIGDAYDAGEVGNVSFEEVKDAYRPQVDGFVAADADMMSLMTVTSLLEARAATELAREAGLPICICFTVETDGQLIDGRAAKDFIEKLDSETASYPAYYGINCAHPRHFLGMLKAMPEEVRERIKEVRVNASEKSHAELDESEDLDRGNVAEVAGLHVEIGKLLDLKVVGGCCGTDEEHVAEMAQALIK